MHHSKRLAFEAVRQFDMPSLDQIRQHADSSLRLIEESPPVTTKEHLRNYHQAHDAFFMLKAALDRISQLHKEALLEELTTEGK
jgi:hypothetical protein